MRVSIITPTWNRCATLEQTFRSVESQHLKPHQHIVVDNLSHDETPEVLQQYASRAPYEVIHLRENDSGIYDAMNKGAKIAEGEALYFLNDDDQLLDTDSLELLAKCVSLAPDGVAFADVVVRNPKTGSAKVRNHRQMNRLTLAEKSICQQATLYSRQAIEKVGPFYSSLKAAGDYDWMIRALVRHRLPAVYLRRSVAVFSEGGISSDPARAVEFRGEMDSVASRYFSPEIRDRAVRYRRFWRKIPFGLRFCPGSQPEDQLNITSHITIGNLIFRDPLSLLDF
jgi:glycosyltransferase